MSKRIQQLLSPVEYALVVGFIILAGIGSFFLLGGVSMALSETVPGTGGTYTEGIVGTPRFVNPLIAGSDADRDLTTLVFSGLMRVYENKLVPDLALSYTMSDDGTTYRFTLRPDAVFHDGTPVTARDVVFTVRAATNPDIKSIRRPHWEGVDVSAEDDRTVVFTLKSPYPLFLENTTLGIMPAHLWESIPADAFPFSSLNTNPIGAGPFKVTAVKTNTSGIPTEYRLEAFRKNPHPPLLDTFIFRFFQTPETLRAAFEEGNIDGAHSLIISDIEHRFETLFSRVFGVFFNQNQNDIFADETVRRALNTALDKESLVATVLYGYGTALDGPLPQRGYRKEGDTQEVARNMLEEAGWEIWSDGIYQKTVKKETKRLAFTIATGNAPELKQVAEALRESWETIGVSVDVQFFEQTDLQVEVIRPRRYDALLFGIVVGREYDLFAFWHSSQRNDPGLNIALYANASVDKLLEKARSAADEVERHMATREAADIITKEVPAIFLYSPHFIYHTPSRLLGVSLNPITIVSDRLEGVRSWYVKTESLWPIFISR